MLTIRVFWSGTTNPVVGKEVVVHSGSGSRKGKTDHSGTAVFEYGRGKYQVYIGGAKVYDGPIVDTQIINL